jgi:hypothetical protein
MVPSPSYQVFTATAHNNWTTAVLSLTHQQTIHSTLLTNSRVRATLLLAVYLQSHCLCAKPLEVHDQRFFFTTERLQSQSHPLWQVNGVLIWIGFDFVKCTYCTYSMLLKILPRALYTNPLSAEDLQSRSYLSYLCYNGSLVTWLVVSLTTAKFNPLIFSMYWFTLSYAANMFILMILYDFCLFPAQFCYMYNHIHMEDWKLRINPGSMCNLKDFQWCGEPCFAGTAILRGSCLLLIPRRCNHKSLLTYQCFTKG